MASASTTKSLEGKVAIITGGASGIGEATVRLFVENGARVVIADIQDEMGIQLANELGIDVATYKHCDVSQECDVESLVEFALSKWGKLDIMFNNAGIAGKAHTREVATMDMVDFDQVMSINTRGMVLGVKCASKAMLHANMKGSIICNASIASISGGIASVAYTVSKHAVLGLMRAASCDLRKHGIRVNCVSPAAMLTPLSIQHIREMSNNPLLTVEQVQQACDNINSLVSGNSLCALDIAHAVLFLASDAASFISGHNLIIDGGLTSCINKGS